MGGEPWPTAQFGELVENFDSIRVPVKEADRRPGRYPYYGASGIVDHVDSYIFDGEYLLVAEDGENLKTRQTPIAFLATGKFWVNNHAHIVCANANNDTRFLMYAMRVADIGSYLTGSTMPKLTQANMNRVPVVVPPLAEQRAIVRILKALDDKIELNRKMNATLEAMALALFKSWFVDFDPVRAKAEGRAPSGMDAQTAKLFPSEFAKLESKPIPKGWRYGSIGEFVELQRGTTYKSALKDLPGPVLLGLGTIQRNGGFRDDKLSTYGGDSPTKLLVYPGELFVSLKDVTQSADLLGAVARVPKHVASGRLTQDTVKLQFTGTIDIGEVLYRTLLTDEYREYCRQHATGTTNLGLSRDDFLSYPIVVAEAPVLHAFNTSIQSLTSRSESSLMESQTLARIRDDLLPRLLSGELSVAQAEREAEAVA